MITSPLTVEMAPLVPIDIRSALMMMSPIWEMSDAKGAVPLPEFRVTVPPGPVLRMMLPPDVPEASMPASVPATASRVTLRPALTMTSPPVTIAEIVRGDVGEAVEQEVAAGIEGDAAAGADVIVEIGADQAEADVAAGGQNDVAARRRDRILVDVGDHVGIDAVGGQGDVARGGAAMDGFRSRIRR